MPCKGSSIALNELVAGRIDATFADLAVLVPLEQSGWLRIIAVMGARSNVVPDVKTATEQGYPNLTMGPWYGIAVPAGTARDVVEKLTATLRTTLETPDVRQRFAHGGYVPVETSGDAMANLIAVETATLKALVDRAQPAVQ